MISSRIRFGFDVQRVIFFWQAGGDRFGRDVEYHCAIIRVAGGWQPGAPRAFRQNRWPFLGGFRGFCTWDERASGYFPRFVISFAKIRLFNFQLRSCLRVLWLFKAARV